MLELNYVNSISFNLDLKRDSDWVSLRAGGESSRGRLMQGSRSKELRKDEVLEWGNLKLFG